MDVSTIWDFRGEIVGSIRPRKGYVPTTVTRIDNDGTVWVTTGDGGEAPASTCAAGVAVGDVVSVSWSGAQMGVVGNASDPAAGTSTVRAVRKAAESAAKVASGAQAIADAIKQHFFTDDNGVHVSTEDGNPTGERNILMNSLGILLRQGSAWLASFSDSAVAFYDGLGNAASNVVAQFGIDGAVIGRSGESHMEMDYRSMRMVDKQGTEFFEVQDLRDDDGTVTISFSYDGNGTTKVFAFSEYVDTSTVSVYVDGTQVTSGITVTNDDPIYSMTYNATVVVFDTAPASGTTVTGTGTITDTATAENMKAYTLGKRADDMMGMYSVATGRDTSARGKSSQAHGTGTIATGRDQTVIGRWNKTIYGTFAHGLTNLPLFIVGNGSSNANRSNAFVLYRNGEVDYGIDVPWTNLPMSSAANAYSSDYTPQYRRWGQVVEVTGAASPKTQVAADGTLSIGTLPSGCRPHKELDVMCQGSGGNVWLLKVKTDGTLEASRYRSGSTSAAMPTSAWLTFNVAFIV